MQNMDITCVYAIVKIGRNTTEPYEAQNVLPLTPNPNRRRNNNNENTQNTVTRAKLSQQIKQAKYAKKQIKKISVHAVKRNKKTQTR